MDCRKIIISALVFFLIYLVLNKANTFSIPTQYYNTTSNLSPLFTDNNGNIVIGSSSDQTITLDSGAYEAKTCGNMTMEQWKAQRTALGGSLGFSGTFEVIYPCPTVDTPDGTKSYIINDTVNNKALLIAGNSSSGKRSIRMLDNVQVDGNMNVQKEINIGSYSLSDEQGILVIKRLGLPIAFLTNPDPSTNQPTNIALTTNTYPRTQTSVGALGGSMQANPIPTFDQMRGTSATTMIRRL